MDLKYDIILGKIDQQKYFKLHFVNFQTVFTLKEVITRMKNQQKKGLEKFNFLQDMRVE